MWRPSCGSIFLTSTYIELLTYRFVRGQRENMPGGGAVGSAPCPIVLSRGMDTAWRCRAELQHRIPEISEMDTKGIP